MLKVLLRLTCRSTMLSHSLHISIRFVRPSLRKEVDHTKKIHTDSHPTDDMLMSYFGLCDSDHDSGPRSGPLPIANLSTTLDPGASAMPQAPRESSLSIFKHLLPLNSRHNFAFVSSRVRLSHPFHARADASQLFPEASTAVMPLSLSVGTRQSPSQWFLVRTRPKGPHHASPCACAATPAEAAAAVNAAATELARLQVRIHGAAAAEEYGRAATLRRRATALQTADPLTQLRAALSAAVTAQDYAGAAALRDASRCGLIGWWRVAPDGCDVWGHLVHISDEYGRLAARAYTPSHIAGIHGWRQEIPYCSSLGNATVAEAGVPLFEIVFYRGDDGASRAITIAQSLRQLSG